MEMHSFCVTSGADQCWMTPSISIEFGVFNIKFISRIRGNVLRRKYKQRLLGMNGLTEL